MKKIFKFTTIIILLLIGFLLWKFSILIFWDYLFKFVDVRICNKTELDFSNIYMNNDLLEFKNLNKNTCTKYKKTSILTLEDTNLYWYAKWWKISKTLWEKKWKYHYQKYDYFWARRGVLDFKDYIFFWKYTLSIDGFDEDIGFNSIYYNIFKNN